MLEFDVYIVAVVTSTMDRLANLVRDFCALSDNTDDATFARCFTAVVITMLDMIAEFMIDARDIRETNQFYALIFDDICRLRDNMQAYHNYLD